MIYIPETFQDSVLRLFPEFAHEEKSIRTVTLQVTEDCNLRCSYCYQICKEHNSMSFETAIEFLSLMLNDEIPWCTTENTCGIALEFIGGEPFLEVELIDRICEWFLGELIRLDHPWKHFIKFSFSTNGVLYFNQNVQNFLKKYRPYLSISFSIDGDKELHDSCRVFEDGTGSYDIAVAAAKDWLYKQDEYLSTKATLSPDNVQYTAKALKSLIEIGYKVIYINCIYESGWILEHAKILYQQMSIIGDWLIDNDLHDSIYIRLFDEALFVPMSPEDDKNWCGGTGDMIALDWRGYIYPCLRYMPSSLGDDMPPLTFGKIIDGKLIISEEEKQCFDCMQCVTRASQSTQECMECPIATGCAWCSAYNYQCGSYNVRQTNICCMHKASALANFVFWTKYHEKLNDGVVTKCYMKPEWIRELLDDEYEEFMTKYKLDV